MRPGGVWTSSTRKLAESSIARPNVCRSYEDGHSEVTKVLRKGWASETRATTPVQSETFDPIATIDRLVLEEMAQRPT